MCLPLPDIIKVTHSHSGAGERSTGLAEIDVCIAQYNTMMQTGNSCTTNTKDDAAERFSHLHKVFLTFVQRPGSRKAAAVFARV